MSDVAQPKCRCWYRTFLRWFVCACALILVAGSLSYFIYRVNVQLSALGMSQIVVAVLFSLFLSFFLSFMGAIRSRSSVGERLAVHTVLLAIVSCPLVFVYGLVEHGKPLAAFYGGGGSGVVSAYEAFFVWALCLIYLIIQMTLVHYDSLHREANLIVGGSLAVVGWARPMAFFAIAIGE